jgi:hypothetical protein
MNFLHLESVIVAVDTLGRRFANRSAPSRVLVEVVTGRFAKILTPAILLMAFAPAAAAEPAGDRWLTELQREIAGDLDAGKPLVVHVHVPLCANEIIRCGNANLGDGDDPDRNLYWATSGGFRGWFNRRGSGWKQVLVKASPGGAAGRRRGRATIEGSGELLETRVWRRRVRPRRGFAAVDKKQFDVYVVAHAWRGSAIREAMDTYTRHLYGGDVESIAVADGTRVRAGGGAHVVGFVGHNGWMDVDRYDFAEIGAGAKRASKRRKGTIAVACITEDYLSPQVSSPRRVPLLMTKWLLFAGAHSFEGAVSALAEGRDLAGIRRAAIRAYAAGQGKTPARVSGGFTNPSDKRWKSK